MNRRLLATVLWFLVGWTAGSMATYFLGLPEGINVVLATLIAAVVWADPAHLFWPQGRRVLREIPESKTVPGARLVPK
jgi:hypothetical protein